MLYPLLFETNLLPIVWGGHNLWKIKGMSPIDEPIGESWEVSAVPGRQSLVSYGLLQGRTLRELTKEYGAALLGQSVYDKFGGEFPLLVKLIDAEGDLSIQVHPNDEQAMQRHGCMGKTEMWYVLDAKPGAYLYAGFSHEITQEEYLRRMEEGTICEVLAKHSLHPGDAFFIPAGCIHAICSGIFVAEVQQSSDITYRIYDYGRMGMDGKPRELHTELAKDVLDFTMHSNNALVYSREKNTPNMICTCRYFEVRRLSLDAPLHRQMKHHDSFVIYMCLNGSCTLGGTVELNHGQSCLVPAACADDILLAPKPRVNDGQAELLEIFIPKED